MYTVTVVNPTGEYTIHNPYDETLKVVDPVLTLELNKSGTLTFSISPENPNKSEIIPLASEVYVYRDNAVYWVGRPIQVEENFNLMVDVTCEGILGYLLDTQVPPFNFTESNSIRGTDCLKKFLQRLVNRHNAELSASWVDQRKKFSVGDVTVYDSNNNLARSSEDYKSTLETINNKLLETHGGYLRVRYSGNTRFIDYIDTFGDATQPISFGDNLLDLKAHVKTEEIATSVIPRGAQKDSSDEYVTLAGYTPSATVRNRISELTHGGAIRTVGSNSSFTGFTGIYDKAGEDAHGRVYVVQSWDDVTLQENLALKAAEYIGKISVLGKTIDLSAIDLAQIDIDYNSFNIGEIATVVSMPHDLNAEYQITQMRVDLHNPANSTLTLGGEMRTFTFDNTKKQADIVTELQTGITEAVHTATSLLSGGKGGYLIIRQDEDTGQPYEILIMDQATETAATNCVRINKNGLGFGKKARGQSASSWVYRNAWTIDGNLRADFITTGTLNANLLKTGTISDPAGNTKINLSNGTLSMKKGSINLGSGKFTVNDSGDLSAVSGKIAGFTLTNNLFYKSYKIGKTTFYLDIQSASSRDESAIRVSTPTKSAFSINGGGGFYCAPITSAGKWGNIVCEMTTSEAYLYNSSRGAKVEVNNSGLTLNTGRQTTSHSGNLYISTSGAAYYALEGSSSRKIKTDIKEIENEELNPDNLYDVEVIQYKYKDDFLSDDDDNRGKDLVGFIVEDLNEIYSTVVQKEDNEDSKTWTWSPYRIIPPMLKLIQDQKKQINSLEERITKLESMIIKEEEQDG